ncbi:MAG: cobalamin-dependent protein [Deltaproteobacteria bacterium]|nr:cobalamin-dependent protein [Deltaproteobacteria bacterium]MBW2140659.1 cobalamin-dependent protein [Deltaproteobacteria bacterium]
MAKGSVKLYPMMGLKTIDEQVEGIKELYKKFEERGMDPGIMLIISNLLNGLPPHLRKNAPSGTSFVYNSPGDFKRIAQAAPIYPLFADHMIGTPNSVESTVNALSAGSLAIGTVSQFAWRYPNWDDDVSQLSETIKAIGVAAAKVDKSTAKSYRAWVGSYVGDGISSGFLDHVSIVGYTLLEKYVVQELCGVPYRVSLGGLMSNITKKLATWLAIDEVLRNGDDNPVIGHVEGNTIEVTEDPASNYGLVVGDFIPFAILERKYKTGAFYCAKPVTEAIRVPTLDEIVDVASACNAALSRVIDFENDGLFNEAEIIKLKDILVFNGKKFFENTLNGFSELGVDISDPLQMLLALRRLGPTKLEEMFHPGERNTSEFRGIVAFCMTDVFEKYNSLADSYIENIHRKGLVNAFKDKKIITGSADTHDFAVYVINKVLSEIGCKVKYGGADLDPKHILDLAQKEQASFAAVSIHDGQCIDWGKRYMEEAKKRNQELKLFMGGVLNTMVEWSSEPVDATDKLIELGITPCLDLMDLARIMKEL